VLSDREKLILHFCCMMTIAKMTGVPNKEKVIGRMIEQVRKNRCRSIAPEDLDDMLEEVSTEMLTSKTMFQHLMEDTVWSMTGERSNKNTNWKDMR